MTRQEVGHEKGTDVVGPPLRTVRRAGCGHVPRQLIAAAEHDGHRLTLRLPDQRRASAVIEGTSSNRRGNHGVRRATVGVLRRPRSQRTATSRMSISRLSRGGDQRPSCSPKMRRGGLRRISPSCRSCCERHSKPHTHTGL
jgi:hypothetical protein